MGRAKWVAPTKVVRFIWVDPLKTMSQIDNRVCFTRLALPGSTGAVGRPQGIGHASALLPLLPN
eukprot:1735791-Heterocapsa_arctica.AAC.1